MIEVFLGGFFTLFEFGTIGFWLMCVVISGIMMAFLEYHKSGWATFTFLLTIFLLYKALGGGHLFDHPRTLALYAFLYIFVIGVIWAVFKWWRKVENLAEKCKELKYEFCRENLIGDGPIPPDLLQVWNYRIDDFQRKNKSDGLKIDPSTGIIPPHPNDHKEEIYLWIFFWPWSMVWFCLNEPIRKLSRFIYLRIRGSLVAISERAFKGIKEDFAKKEPPPVQTEEPPRRGYGTHIKC